MFSRPVCGAESQIDLGLAAAREAIAAAGIEAKDIDKEIVEKLFISEQTVKNHLHNIFDKLGLSDRLELALYAIHHRLIDQT